jgi:hypothetical protein
MSVSLCVFVRRRTLLIVLQIALNPRWNNRMVIRIFLSLKTLGDFYLFQKRLR